MTGFARFGS